MEINNEHELPKISVTRTLYLCQQLQIWRRSETLRLFQLYEMQAKSVLEEIMRRN